jgi:hypothetical protein
MVGGAKLLSWLFNRIFENTLNSKHLLKRLGLKVGHIYEGIVCTYNPDNTPNAAPMGITPLKGNRVAIRPYRDTATYRNLIRTGCATVNFCSDPLLYYFSALKFLKEVRLKGVFKRSDAVNSPELRKADAVLSVDVERIRGEEEKRAFFECTIISIKGPKVKKVEPYSRAPHALMECIIHATRIEPYAKSNLNEAKKLLSLIEHHRSIISRVAKHSAYAQAADEIYTYCRKVVSEYEAHHKDA